MGIFACCRELFSPNRHCNYFAGLKHEAELYYNEFLKTKHESMASEVSKKKEEAVRKMNELAIQKLEQIEALEKKKEESNCKSMHIN